MTIRDAGISSCSSPHDDRPAADNAGRPGIFHPLWTRRSTFWKAGGKGGRAHRICHKNLRQGHDEYDDIQVLGP